mmetsp:Transcript_27590/g.58950  ORF Transcript_27590/g.58950 Transcript_27590/m.58950 type:complete len:88 (+) Transcript_27590:20-283(+)
MQLAMRTGPVVFENAGAEVEDNAVAAKSWLASYQSNKNAAAMLPPLASQEIVILRTGDCCLLFVLKPKHKTVVGIKGNLEICCLLAR